MNEANFSKVKLAVQTLQMAQQIRRVAGNEENWYFVRLPNLPPQPTVADLIIEKYAIQVTK
jgi:hypothetical protein